MDLFFAQERIAFVNRVACCGDPHRLFPLLARPVLSPSFSNTLDEECYKIRTVSSLQELIRFKMKATDDDEGEFRVLVIDDAATFSELDLNAWRSLLEISTICRRNVFVVVISNAIDTMRGEGGIFFFFFSKFKINGLFVHL